MIVLHLDARSGVPPFRQIAAQVRHAIATGAVAPGEQLPTVKEIVASLAINPNTVFKAYRELEHEGLVEGRPGAGTFVLRRPAGPPPAVLASLGTSLASWVARARTAGLDDEAMTALLGHVLREDAEEESA